MSPSNPVTTVSTSVRIGDLKYAQVSIMRQYTSRHHSATLASQLRVGRIMRHLLREIDPLMGMPPYSYGSQHTERPVVTIEPETPTEAAQLATLELEAADQPVRMCAHPDCINAADMADSGTLCLQHAVAQYGTRALAEQWDAASILRREG